MKRFKISFDETTQDNAVQEKEIEQSVDSISSSFSGLLKGDINGKRVTIWGLTKPNGRPNELALELIDWLLEQGATVAVHDPIDIESAKQQFGDRVEFHSNQWNAARQSSAVVVTAEHEKYRYIDPGFFRWYASDAILFDIPDCVELDTCLQDCIEHYTVDSCGKASIVRFPTQPEYSPQANDSRWQNFLVSSAG